MKDKLSELFDKTNMAYQCGDKIAAEQVYNDMRKLLSQLTEESHRINANWCIYKLLSLMNRKEEAITYLQPLKEKTGDYRCNYNANLEEGICFMALGEKKKGLASFDQAFRLAESHQNNYDMAEASKNLAKYYYLQKDMKQAMYYCCKTFHCAQQGNDVRMESLALISIARVHHKNGNLNLALETLRDAENLVVGLKDLNLIYQAEIKRAQIYMEKNNDELVHQIINDLNQLNEPN